MKNIGSFEHTRHPARLPECKDGGAVRRHRVAIVGGGPVGLGLALALAAWGIASVVIEADDTVCVGSRAICISRRSLQILEQLGALPGFLETGLPWEGGRSFYRGEQILHFTMPHDDRQKLPPMINIQQYYIEQFLVDACARQPNLIDIRWATELVGFEQDGRGASLNLRAAGEDAATRFHLLVSDIGLPGLDGYELIRIVRGEFGLGPARLRALALTAFARAEDQRRSLDAGYQAHLVKPYQLPQLIAMLRQLAPPAQSPSSSANRPG